MVCKKSEYRKQFRKPSWDSHIEHYQEKVDYRTYRRFLEHRHTFIPWDWESSSSNSSCSDENQRRPQTAPTNINNNGGGMSKGRKKDVQHAKPTPVSDERKREAQERLAPPRDGAAGVRGSEPQRNARKTLRQIQQPSQPSHIAPGARPRTSPPKTRKERPPWQPPLAAYGWADSGRDFGSKLTYNVKSSAHPAYVHPSAMRALKNRDFLAAERQKEEDRRARSGLPSCRAMFNVVPPRDNVWMTEYQSSFCSPGKPT